MKLLLEELTTIETTCKIDLPDIMHGGDYLAGAIQIKCNHSSLRNASAIKLNVKQSSYQLHVQIHLSEGFRVVGISQKAWFLAFTVKRRCGWMKELQKPVFLSVDL